MSFSDSFLAKLTKPIPMANIPNPTNGNIQIVGSPGRPPIDVITAARVASIVQSAQNPNQKVKNTFTNQSIVNRPVKTTWPFTSRKRPIKNSLNELEKKGFTCCRRTRPAETGPTAASRASVENIDRRVAERRWLTDSSRENMLSNSTGEEPYTRC